MRSFFPLPQTGLAYGYGKGYAKSCEAVEDRGADLDLCNLTIEVAYREPLSQQLNAMHLRLDAAPPVVSAPSSPKGPAEVFRSAQGLVSNHGTGSDGLPRLQVLAGRDDSMGAAIRDGIVALAGVVGAIRCNAADFLVLRDLAEQIEQDGCVTDVASGDFVGPDLQRFFVDPEVDLAPEPPFGSTMLAGVPLAFALDLDARAIHCPAGHHEVMSREGISRRNGP